MKGEEGGGKCMVNGQRIRRRERGIGVQEEQGVRFLSIHDSSLE